MIDNTFTSDVYFISQEMIIFTRFRRNWWDSKSCSVLSLIKSWFINTQGLNFVIVFFVLICGHVGNCHIYDFLRHCPLVPRIWLPYTLSICILDRLLDMVSFGRAHQYLFFGLSHGSPKHCPVVYVIGSLVWFTCP